MASRRSPARTKEDYHYNDVPITSHRVCHATEANQALHQRDVDLSVWSVFPKADLTYLFWCSAKEQRKLRNPLIKQSSCGLFLN